MAADPQCQKAYDNALDAAKAAAKALGIEPDASPLVKELVARGKKIPDGTDSKSTSEFISDMEQLKEMADEEKTMAN